MATGLRRHSQDGQLRFTVRRDFYSDRVAHICAMGFDAAAACAMLRECGSVDETMHHLLDGRRAGAASTTTTRTKPAASAATAAATTAGGSKE